MVMRLEVDIVLRNNGMDHLKSSLPGSRAVKIRHKVRLRGSHQIKTWSISEKVEEYIRVMVFVLSLSPLKAISNFFFSFFFYFVSRRGHENFRLFYPCLGIFALR